MVCGRVAAPTHYQADQVVIAPGVAKAGSGLLVENEQTRRACGLPPRLAGGVMPARLMIDLRGVGLCCHCEFPPAGAADPPWMEERDGTPFPSWPGLSRPSCVHKRVTSER